jgi:FG-GAP-like repeat/PASTA domain
MRIAFVIAGLVVLGGSLGASALQLPRREDPPCLLDDGQEGPRDLAEARVRHGTAEPRQGQSRRQPRAEALVRKALALASLLVLGSSVSAAAPTGSAPSFAPARSYATGRYPHQVAIGDLNGDGKRDLVTANQDANTVSLLLNRGDGRLRAKRDFPAGRGPGSVAIADLTGNGERDLAIANAGASTVSVLLNRGDGSFRAKRDHETGESPSSVAIGDLNGDGKPDLVTANQEANTVSLLLNRGDGSFQAKVDYATGLNPASVAIGDLNGDGKPDLATANIGTVSVLLNGGDASFKAQLEYPTGRLASSVAIGDLNGDGKRDLAIANRGSWTVAVLLNSGEGSFQAKVDYATGRGPSSVAIGDLNGDGKPDLATANAAANTVSVLANRGDGSFQAKRDYRAGVRPRRPDPASVAIRDLDGDGRPDLATANADNTVSVLLNRPGLCTVQKVEGKTLPAAKRAIGRANCRVGEIRSVYSKWVEKGRVISQKPKPGRVLPGGGKVNLVVSLDRRPS